MLRVFMNECLDMLIFHVGSVTFFRSLGLRLTILLEDIAGFRLSCTQHREGE